MRLTATVTAVLVSTCALVWSAEPGADRERYWPQWRGPQATGVSSTATPPVEWSEGRNVRWKVETPGWGNSTPVVWGDRLYLTTAVATGESVPADSVPPPARAGGFRHPQVSSATEVQRFVVLAIERATGDLAWERSVGEGLPHEGRHEFGSFASPSPVTDGERVYASFGSRGLYALDMDGQVLWEKDLGDMTIKLGFGEGSSPALHEEKLLFAWDHEGQSFMVALDKRTGEEIWRVDRDEMTSWATPLVVEHGGGAQVVTSATGLVRSYDVETGSQIWQTAGMTLNAIPSPVVGDGVVYLTSGFRGNALLAIRLSEARGDLSDTGAIVWQLDRDTPYVPSPLLYEGKLYLLKRNSGVLSCLDARTGDQLYQERLPGVENVFASPVAADGRLYFTGREGTTLVIGTGPELEVLASNRLDEHFDASMALVDGDVYLRGRSHLYCISENEPE